MQNKCSAQSLSHIHSKKVLERGLGKTYLRKRFSLRNFDYSSSTLIGLPVAMDSLHAMVKETDLNASA